MSRENSGKLVHFTSSDGTVQKALARYSDQSKEFVGRVFLRLLNDDLTEKVGDGGKKVVSVKFPKELTVIGFVD